MKQFPLLLNIIQSPSYPDKHGKPFPAAGADGAFLPAMPLFYRKTKHGAAVGTAAVAGGSYIFETVPHKRGAVFYSCAETGEKAPDGKQRVEKSAVFPAAGGDIL